MCYAVLIIIMFSCFSLQSALEQLVQINYCCCVKAVSEVKVEGMFICNGFDFDVEHTTKYRQVKTNTDNDFFVIFSSIYYDGLIQKYDFL